MILNNELTMTKRQYRNDMSKEQRAKIAQANTGKHQSEQTKQKISKSMVNYWAKLPFKPVNGSGSTNNTVTY